MRIELPRLSRSQSRMVELVNNRTLAHQPGKILVGPQERGLMGLTLDLRKESFRGLFTEAGTDLTAAVKTFQHRLQNDTAFQLRVKAWIPGYDVRSENADEAFFVLLGRAYATSLADKNDKRDGFVIHLGHDAFWQRHNRAISILAMTLIKSGVCDNGGGIVYWGINDGGTLKHMPMLERAETGEGGFWINGTVSHKTEPGLVGGKFGANGQVLCAEDLIAETFDRMLTGQYLPLKEVERPEEYVVNVGETAPFFAAVAHRAIAARTTMPDTLPLEQTLEGMRPILFTDRNPMISRTVAILRLLGAEPQLVGDLSDIHEPNAVRDPNETPARSAAIAQLTGYLSGLDWQAQKENPILFYDPDCDRMGLVALAGPQNAELIKGTNLLALMTHNLATHNPLGLKMGTGADMRAFIGASILGKHLTAAGYPIEVFPAVPGYNMFHVALEEAQHRGLSAAAAIEETSHCMTRLYTSRAFGAPVELVDQGGDNGPLTSILFLGMQKHMWEGRNPAEQLAFINRTFDVPPTDKHEMKPMISSAQGMAKIDVHNAIKVLARHYFAGKPGWQVEIFDTGARISHQGLMVATGPRSSKSGSGFTISSESLTSRPEDGDFIHRVGAALMMAAVGEARAEMQDPGHPHHAIKDFEFLTREMAEIAATIGDPHEVLRQAAER